MCGCGNVYIIDQEIRLLRVIFEDYSIKTYPVKVENDLVYIGISTVEINDEVLA